MAPRWSVVVWDDERDVRDATRKKGVSVVSVGRSITGGRTMRGRLAIHVIRR